MDSLAYNYDPLATSHDDSCDESMDVRMKMHSIMMLNLIQTMVQSYPII